MMNEKPQPQEGTSDPEQQAGPLPDETRRRLIKKLGAAAVAVPAATFLLDASTKVAYASP